MTDLDKVWRKYAARLPGLLEKRPDFRFDPDHYGAWVPDLAGNPAALQNHWRTHGHPPNLYAQIRTTNPEIDRVLAKLVIDTDLSLAIANGQPEAYELACELIRLGEPVDAEMSNFVQKHYRESYHDIATADVDCLRHYLLFGAAEGRRTVADLRAAQRKGRRLFEASRPTCLIAVNEFARTGAPIVGLDLAREAAESHNVIVAGMRDGPLIDDFRNHACEVVISSGALRDFDYYLGESFSHIDFAILNSVDTFGYVPLLVARDIPFLAYIHEFADYTFPTYKSTFISLFSDLLVFSSEHVRESWAGRLKDIEFDVARDSRILPQRDFAVGGVSRTEITTARSRLSALIGRDLSRSRLVCGAGHLQWRKGTDIFAMTAQICRAKDPGTVFLWIGDGRNPEDMAFGVWMDYHLRQIGEGRAEGNLFFLPAGPFYLDVLAASDAMLLSSRLDPLPNVVFDALDRGCRIVQFEGATGFSDSRYQSSEHLVSVEFANPAAAADALLALPSKQGSPPAPPPARPKLFRLLRQALRERLAAQRYFVRGASQIDVPILFTTDEADRPLRIREREKILRYRRRFVWRDLDEVEDALSRSENWVHRNLRLAPYGMIEDASLPDFAIHIHAFYTDDLAADLRGHRAFHQARRIVVTTDTDSKADEIDRIARAEGVAPEIVVFPNRGRDILPFLELFRDDSFVGKDEIWCHLHQKKSLASARAGDVWRRFLLRILLGDESSTSAALAHINRPGVGLVAPFDPHHVPWNASRALLARLAPRLPGPMPDNPLLFPVGNMFWVRRPVVQAMIGIFGSDYPWPNEPIANDGTEFHLIERLWPAMTTHLGLESVFLHKLDEKRI